GPARTYANLMLVFLLCGFWHGASWNFVIWGAWHGAFLVVERLGFGRALAKWPAPLRHVYTLLAVMLGWVFFKADTVQQAQQYLGALVGLSSARFDLSDVWTREVWIALLLAAPCCLPIVPWLTERLRRDDVRGWGSAAIECVGAFVFLALS